MARAFIAIRFDEGFKQGLVSMQDELFEKDGVHYPIWQARVSRM